MKIHIPFIKEMKKAILEDRKIQTARYKSYGKMLDWFEIEERTFELIADPYPDTVENVANQFDREGFNTKEEFIKCWGKIHPTRGYQPLDIVLVHQFAEFCEGDVDEQDV